MTALALALQDALGGRWSVRPLQASAFCATWRAEGDVPLFVKSLPAAQSAVLDAEADGLAALAATRTIRVPAVVRRWDHPAAGALLALEWLPLRAPDAGFGARFGAALAALHRAPAGDGRFGWHRDNFLGATPQANRPHDDWVAFVAGQRLGAMRDRLPPQPALRAAVDEVIRALPRFFADGRRPAASLIHGDLWSGNWGMLEDGTPVVYDPAVSCSDAQAELAMMELFGVLPAGFREAYGMPPGYAARRGLYQLYHLLNHAVLFGGGYAAQALALARSLAGITP